MRVYHTPSVEANHPPALPPTDTGTTDRAIECCRALVSDRGDVSGARIATQAFDAYRQLAGTPLTAFFDRLASEFAPDPDLVRQRAAAYLGDPSERNLQRLGHAVESPRRELFRRLNWAPGGTAALIDMRARVLAGVGHNPSWAAIDADLVELLTAWFHTAFLEFRRIDWRTSDVVLEKLIEYEAVHQIRDWRELERRLQPDRRCFALFHPALPDEPLIFTELAFTSELSARVQPLLDPESPVLDAGSCTCAMFYSISSCHKGLHGVPFGTALIRQVVEALEAEFPRLTTFATVSPVPGFRAWLTAAAAADDPRLIEIADMLQTTRWTADAAESAKLEADLLRLCARYLLLAKRGQEPADPVARFHLGNGARLHRLNWLGDLSAAGIARSAGLTANYVYRLSEIEQNHHSYITGRQVIASRRIQRLVTA
jgi:malonyl-CoA decarboxylase